MQATPRVNHLILIVAGFLLCTCFVGMVLLGNLLENVVPFLALNGAAYLVYGATVWWLLRAQLGGKRALVIILVLAVLFRVILLLTTPPTLSSDVYRYIWDGRLINAGVNPYAFPVDAPQLDRLDMPQRALVNHNWMASPYLPVAQLYFAGVYAIAPDSALAFQIAAVLVDLLTVAIVSDLLRRLGTPRSRVLIYAWCPLSIVEFGHGAHVDSLMISLMMAALWLLIALRSRVGSAGALAAATLTKFVPALLLPVVLRRWGWKGALVYAGALVAICLPFVLGPGLGLIGPLDGVGLLGASRIYAARWNYNGGIYHWLEVIISGYPTQGAVPPEIVGWGPIQAAKAFVTICLCLALAYTWLKGRSRAGDDWLLRLALLPLGAYLLLTTTVHPWYATIVLPLLPFLPGRRSEDTRSGRFLVPWLVFAALVPLSYLTYLDPASLREYSLVRLVEYVPLYLLLIWAAWPASAAAATPAPG